MKILLIEDDPSAAAVLSDVLTAQFYTVDIAPDGRLGLDLATSGDYELILLDLLIPEVDGITLCRKLRAYGFQKPILLLTAKDSTADVVRGLDAGADEYVTKPYDLSELLARIRALLRRGETRLAPTLLTWGNLCVNPVSAEVTYLGQPISLSPKEYNLLGLFLRNPHRVFSRSAILDRLWSINTSPGEGTITNLVKDLRHKLKAVGMSSDLLETVYGLGYRLRIPPEPSKPNASSKPKEHLDQDDPSQEGLASIHKVLQRYQGTFAARLKELEQVEIALRDGTISPAMQQKAVQESHKLAGSLGSFGYGSGSHLARSIEHWLSKPENLRAANAPQLAQLIENLKQELTKPPTPLTLITSEVPSRPVVLVWDEQSAFMERLQLQALERGMQVKWIADDAIASLPSPQTILLNLHWSQAGKTGLAMLEKFKEQWPSVPILVMAAQDSLSDRVTVSRLGAARFLHQTGAIAPILDAIAQVLYNFPAKQAAVLILDDDPAMLEMLHSLLQPWGIEVTTLHNPAKFWEILVSTQPDLILLDLEMPEFSGIDLCRVVRQDPQWGNLPILVVTAHTDMESIQQVFLAGADDFIGKPIVGPELVTRVISRIDRSRL